MKAALPLLLLLLLTSSLAAQSPSLSGSVVDKATGSALTNANVILIHLPDSARSGTVTKSNGSFVIENVSRGRYLVVFSFIGYTDDTMRVTVTNRPVDLGKVALQEGSVRLNAVEVTGILPGAQVKGDTTEFNAAAFKANPDATAEDLIAKAPGVTNEGGKIKSQGEEVKQVLVDGRPFFGNDPTAALRTIPAELVDRIQIFDQQSEQSRFTGFDDGNTTKTVNLVTRQSMRNGQFGRFFGGYGDDNKYKAGATLNLFDGDQRLTILAQSNNVNEQNFAIEDILGTSGGGGGPGGGSFRMVTGAMGGGAATQVFSMMGRGGRGGGGGDIGSFMVTPSGGITTTHALGLNYSDKWLPTMEVSGSYFFNYGENDAKTALQRQFLLSDLSGTGAQQGQQFLAGLSQIYTEDQDASTINTNHRFNMRFDWDIDTSNALLVRPRFTAQQSQGASTIGGRTMMGDLEVNRSDYDRNTDLTGLSFSNSILYRHRFETRGRTFSIEGTTGLSRNNGSSSLQSFTRSFSRGIETSDSLDQTADLDKNGWSLGGNVSYTEPIAEKMILQLSYNVNQSSDESDKNTWNLDRLTGRHDLKDTALTNVFSNRYLTHSVGADWRYQDEVYNMSAGLAWQNATLTGDQSFPFAATVDKTFTDFLPSVTARMRFTREKNLFFFYRTRTSPPSVDQMQNVVDNTNPLQLKIGNPSLEQDYSHNVNLRYMSTNFMEGTYFFIFLGGSLTKNPVVNNTTIALNDTVVSGVNLLRGAQLTRPVNASDDSYSARVMGTYGFPASFLYSNVNVSAFFNLSRSPGLVNGLSSYSTTPTVGGIVTIASNISPEIDFTLSSFSTQSFVRNSVQTSMNTDYFMQNTRFRLNWIFWEGFVLSSDVSHQYTSGYADGYNQNIVLWNVGLGKKFLANNAAEIRLTVFDILNQNQSVTRSSTESYIEDYRTNILQRYALLTFTYTLRNFGSGNATPPRPPREFEPR